MGSNAHLNKSGSPLLALLSIEKVLDVGLEVSGVGSRVSGSGSLAHGLGFRVEG